MSVGKQRAVVGDCTRGVGVLHQHAKHTAPVAHANVLIKLHHFNAHRQCAGLHDFDGLWIALGGN